MKKFFTTILAILLTINAFALDVWNGTAESWTNGSGTEEDPYLIETAENLAYLAEKVNEGFQAQGMEVFKYTYFLMTDDLDLNNINWTPIGNVNYVNSTIEGYYFAGVFDGWYHNIDHLRIQTEESLTGLFAGLGGDGKVKHLSVTNGSITSSGFGAAGIVGAIAGDAVVYQCSFSGNISISNSDTFCGAGGIVCAAAQNSVILECSFSGNATAINSGGLMAAGGTGGIVGIAMDNVVISSCYNTGHLTGTALMFGVAAGIVGATLQENNVSIENCYNTGTLTAKTKGGIFGMVSPINPTKEAISLNVTNCFYLNTCGGTTNYGTSKTASEMQTEQFKNQLNLNSHIFVMDNGTNNGYPILALTGFVVFDATDVGEHSAKLSANIHQGNEIFSRVYFAYGKDDETELQEVEVASDGYVEAILENLDDDTNYQFYLYLEYEDGSFVTSDTPRWFTTEFDGINEVNKNSTVSIYPNPTSDFVFIENIEPQHIIFYSLDGKMIKTVENNNVVDIRDLNKGIYLINIDGATQRIVIN